VEFESLEELVNEYEKNAANVMMSIIAAVPNPTITPTFPLQTLNPFCQLQTILRKVGASSAPHQAERPCPARQGSARQVREYLLVATA
jgi:hypothetical protein